jgi:hypothetical protein
LDSMKTDERLRLLIQAVPPSTLIFKTIWIKLNLEIFGIFYTTKLNIMSLKHNCEIRNFSLDKFCPCAKT